MSSPRPPDDTATDREVERAWRAQSTDLPPASLDDAIRAAARRELAEAASARRTEPLRGIDRNRASWARYAPLAAAASVAALAFVLVQMLPRDEFDRVAAPRPAPAPSSEQRESGTPASDAREPVVGQSRPSETGSADSSPATSAETEAHTPERERTTPAFVADPPSAPRTATPGADATAPPAMEETHREPSATPATVSPSPAGLARVEQPPSPPPEPDRVQTPSVRPASSESASAVQRARPTVDHKSGETPVASAPDTGSAAAARMSSDVEETILTAAADAAAVDRSLVTIVTTQRLTAAGGAPECRQPDNGAPPTPLAGFLVEIDAAGTRLRYHVDERGRIRACAAPAEKKPLSE